MNFLKNTWNSLFKGQSPNPTSTSPNSPAPPPQQQIPQQILQQLFSLSSQLVKQSKNIKDDNVKLKIYGYYKQATQGDCNTEKPQMFDFIGKSKWSAWDVLRGMSKNQAMMGYVKVVAQADPQITKKIQQKFTDTSTSPQPQPHQSTSGLGFKKHQAEDFTYSHPYFKRIEQDEPLLQITHEELLVRNNEPAVYPLHFAIDKQRVQLVQQFLQLLTVQEILAMEDADGNSILEYAELIENQEILQAVRNKLNQNSKQAKEVEKKEVKQEVKEVKNKQQVHNKQENKQNQQKEQKQVEDKQIKE